MREERERDEEEERDPGRLQRGIETTGSA